jgi:hypothetical protein
MTSQGRDNEILKVDPKERDLLFEVERRERFRGPEFWCQGKIRKWKRKTDEREKYKNLSYFNFTNFLLFII